MSAREDAAKKFCTEYTANGCPPIYMGIPTHFTASAMVIHGNSVLLQRHLSFDRWVFPGGHVDPTDSDPWSAAQREATEESGLQLKLEDLPIPLMHIDIINGKHNHKHVDLTFGFGLAALVPPTPPEHESQEIDWFDLHTAAALTPQRMAPAFERLLELGQFCKGPGRNVHRASREPAHTPSIHHIEI